MTDWALDIASTAAAGSALALLVAAQLTLICCGAMQVAPAQAAPEGPVAFDLQNGFNPQAVLRISVRGGLVLTAEAVKELPREDVAHIWKVRPTAQCNVQTHLQMSGARTACPLNALCTACLTSRCPINGFGYPAVCQWLLVDQSPVMVCTAWCLRHSSCPTVSSQCISCTCVTTSLPCC